MSKRVFVFGTATEQALVRTIEELRRENAELNRKLDQILTNKDYEGGVQFWIKKHDAVLLREASLLAENAALRKMLSDADELERYSGSDGKRQWGKCSAWLNPDDAVVIISAKALDAARKEAQP